MLKYPDDWQELTLGDLGEVLMCRRIFQDQTKPSGQIPFYKIGTFGGKADAYITRELYETYKAAYPYPRIGDILISAAGTIGRTLVFDGNDSYFQDSNIVWLNTDETQVDSNFLRLFYQSYPWVNLEGTTIQRLYNSIILNTPIHLPSLSEQKEISETLTVFDTHIANLTELIEKKKAIREGALEDLVSGKTRLSGFTDKWKEMQLGKIRKTKRGKRLVRSQLQQEQRVDSYPVFQNSLEPLGFYNEYSCPAGSVYVIAAGNAGDIGYSEIAFWAADDCYYYEQSNDINQKYLYYYLLFNQKSLSEQTRRTSIPRLSRDILDNLIIQLPKVDEQEAIAQILTDMDNEIHSLEDECDKIKQIREGAMDDLLTGKVRLTD